MPPRPHPLRGSGAGDRFLKALLIDLDDTLLDYSGGVDECWHHACAALAGPAGIDPAGLVTAIVEARRWFWSDPGRHRTERADMLRAWTRITAQALGALGRADEALAAGIARDFAERRWERMTLFPGVSSALEALRARGVPLGMVTNGDATHQRRKIAQHDLERFFDVIVVEGEMGVGKPEEVVYRYALSKLRVKPEDAWMVGDNLEWDVLAPQRLGLRGIWVDGPGQGLPKSCSMAPHRIIRAFAELLTP
ncbi:MAG: HAD family hydrolase [Candidatus Rokuibacteriota bacterium]